MRSQYPPNRLFPWAEPSTRRSLVLGAVIASGDAGYSQPAYTVRSSVGSRMRSMVEHDGSSSPPIDFPVYGLHASWSGWRWFDYYQAKNGDRAWVVGLGHLSTDRRDGIIVSTLRRDYYDMTLSQSQADPLVEIAFDGAIRLGNAMLPDIDVPRPQGLLKALVDHMQYESEHYQDWPVTRWKLDGNPITAPILNFADGWITFTDSTPDVYVSIIGINTSITPSLDAIRVVDLREYGFNPEAPLIPASTLEANEQQLDAKLPSRKSLHPDFLTLIT